MNQQLCGDQWMSLWKNERDILYVSMDDAALIVPVSPQGEVLMITEPSPAYGGRMLGLPAGRVEAGETADIAANRELQEEIGLKAGHLTWLGDLFPFYKYMRCRQSVYLACDFSASRLPGDEDEHWVIEVERVPLRQFESLIATGRLQDSNTIAALYMARSYLAQHAPALLAGPGQG